MSELFVTTLIESIPALLVALAASGGFWTYIEKKKEESYKKRTKTLEKAFQDISNISTKINNTDNALHTLEGQMSNLETLIDELKSDSKLSVAYCRDRLNHLENKYMNMGYIPQEDYVAFKMLGEAYLSCKQNTEVQEKFNYCMEKLPIKNQENNTILDTDV